MAAMCNCMYPPGDPRCCLNRSAEDQADYFDYKPFPPRRSFTIPVTLQMRYAGRLEPLIDLDDLPPDDDDMRC